LLTQKDFDAKFYASLSKEEKALDEVFEKHFEVASLLLRARILRGFSQAQLAKLADVRQSDISRYERGEKSPSLMTLSKLNIALGIEFTAKIKPKVKTTYRAKKVVAKRRKPRIQHF
jgi:transcriptional regulator with XRE-family HTH domain